MMADETIDKIKSSFTKGVAALNVKTSVFLETAKIKTHISTLKNEIDSLKIDIGDRVYSSWKENSFDIKSIEDKLFLIEQKYETIEDLNKKINKLQDQEKEVLGEKIIDADDDETADEPIFTCSNCGTSYKNKFNFCKKCGNKMA